jgi:hypothetical protein
MNSTTDTVTQEWMDACKAMPMGNSRSQYGGYYPHLTDAELSEHFKNGTALEAEHEAFLKSVSKPREEVKVKRECTKPNLHYSDSMMILLTVLLSCVGIALGVLIAKAI